MSHDMGKMPCDEMDKTEKKQDNQHCDGVCFCMHMSSTQIPIVGSDNLIQIPLYSTATHEFMNDSVVNLPYTPDKRPPRV